MHRVFSTADHSNFFNRFCFFRLVVLWGRRLFLLWSLRLFLWSRWLLWVLYGAASEILAVLQGILPSQDFSEHEHSSDENTQGQWDHAPTPVLPVVVALRL